MTKSTLTTETITGVADLNAGYTLGNADVAILKALAAELLAVREAQPVWVDTEIHEAIQYILQGRMSGAGRYVSFHRNQSPKGFKPRMPIYTAPPAPAVPAGFKLVPVEPTPEMIAATEIDGDEYYFESDEAAETWMANKFKAMLAAAPTPTNE